MKTVRQPHHLAQRIEYIFFFEKKKLPFKSHGTQKQT